MATQARTRDLAWTWTWTCRRCSGTWRRAGDFAQGLRPTRAKTRILYDDDPTENTTRLGLGLATGTWCGVEAGAARGRGRRGAGLWRGAGSWRDVSSVQRDHATGNVTQRGAKRQKNARLLAMLKGIFYLSSSICPNHCHPGRAGAADVIDVLADVMNVLLHTFCPQIHSNLDALKKFETNTRSEKKRASVV
jgi:hypothetical protein